MLQALRKRPETTDNKHQINQTIAPCMVRGNLLYSKKVEENGHKVFPFKYLHQYWKTFTYA